MNLLEKIGLLMLMAILTGFVTHPWTIVFNLVVGLILFFGGGVIEEICIWLNKYTVEEPK